MTELRPRARSRRVCIGSKVEPETLKALQAVAARKGVSVSQTVAFAVERALKLGWLR